MVTSSRGQFRYPLRKNSLAETDEEADRMAWHDGIEQGSAAYRIAASTSRFARVVAGPGTGKSFAMKRKVARLLEEGVVPSQILPVTFTRVAAEDLHRELIGIGVPGCEHLTGTTLHSLALRILMRNHVLGATGRSPRPLNEFELKPLEADLAVGGIGVRQIRRLLKAYEAAWARLQQDEPGFVQSQEDAEFERKLLVWLRFHRAMLIGEVIPQLHQYLFSSPAAPERNEYQHILVDEYQDLNKAEQGVVELLSGNASVCVVGDDDQSIYSFKHAHPEGIRAWITSHGGGDDIGLDECRRCPTRVVEMANALIAQNQSRPIARMLAPMDSNGRGEVEIIQYQNLDLEVLGVAQRISALIQSGVRPGDILVLAQRGVVGTPIYELLVEQGVPARSYYAEAELDVEDAQRRFAILKLLVDREDRVALRWLLGAGSQSWRAGSYRHLRVYCDAEQMGPWEALQRLRAGEIKIRRANHLLERFGEISDQIEELEELILNSDLSAVVDSLFPEGDESVRDLRALALNAIEAHGADDRAVFLRELSNSIVKPEVPTEIEEVRIMSLHKSKGLSAPVTFIAGCVEGLLPKQPSQDIPQADQVAALEEQRRLFFVGVTRVKAAPADGKPGSLVLTYSREMPMASAMRAGIEPAGAQFGTANLVASRFIRELGPTAPTPTAG